MSGYITVGGGFETLEHASLAKAAAIARKWEAEGKDVHIKRTGEPPRGLILAQRAAWRVVPRADWPTGLPEGVLRGDPLEYLDKKIRYWREQMHARARERSTYHASTVGVEKAISYVDAYQTMRHDLFGAVLSDDA